jgi:hypothetical protein
MDRVDVDVVSERRRVAGTHSAYFFPNFNFFKTMLGFKRTIDNIYTYYINTLHR